MSSVIVFSPECKISFKLNVYVGFKFCFCIKDLSYMCNNAHVKVTKTNNFLLKTKINY
jgi:hypothetical protein